MNTVKLPALALAALLLGGLLLSASATARPHFLPRLPRINLGKAVQAAAYPVTKSVVNGGKTVLKTANIAENLGVVPSIGPPGVNGVVKKVIGEASRH